VGDADEDNQARLADDGQDPLIHRHAGLADSLHHRSHVRRLLAPASPDAALPVSPDAALPARDPP
jgi:hypothetical protein